MGGALRLAIFVGGTLLLFPNLLSMRSIAAMLVYGVLTFVYYLRGNAFFNTINSVVVPFLSMTSALLIVEYALTYDRDFKYTRMVIVISIACNVVMAMITIPQLQANPNLLRGTYAFTSGDHDNPTLMVLDYSTLHGLSYIFAPMVFLCRKIFRRRKAGSVFWLLALVVLFVIEVMGNAATPFLVSIMMVLMALLFNAERFNTKIIGRMIFASVVAILVISPRVAIPLIEGVQGYLNPTAATYHRLDNIKDSMIYDESDGDLAARQSLYDKSRTLFFESPLIGTNDPERIGHHSWIIDRLACFGLIFFVPIMVLFVTHIKRVYRSLHHTRVVYSIGVLGYLLMLYLKGEFGFGVWLYIFAILPLLCRYIDYFMDKEISYSNQ